MLVDSHAHLDFTDDLEGWLLRAKAEGVNKIITVGTSIEVSKKSVEIAEKYSSDDLKIFATCGIHPEDGKDEVGKSSLYQCINTLKQIANSSPKVIGVGECGLDYYLDGKKRIQQLIKIKNFKENFLRSR